MADDMSAEETLSFAQMAYTKPDETVIFSWVVFASKEARDAANANIFADSQMKGMMDMANHIFDCKHMAHCGFKQLVHA